MKKILSLFTAIVLSLIFGIGRNLPMQATLANQEYQPNVITPQPIIQEMIDQVSQSRTLADLRRLTGVDELCVGSNCGLITSRYTGSSDLQRVESYVYSTLINLHYSVEDIAWSRGGFSDHNILAHKRGVLYPNEEIYFIAHLDGVPNPGPAADDDGSGSAALLELARILANRFTCRSVTLFFSTGEEEGTLGSSYFVDNYSQRLGNIKYMVNVEMLGYDSNGDGAMELFNGNQSPGFVQLLMDIIDAYPINLSPEIYSDCG